MKTEFLLTDNWKRFEINLAKELYLDQSLRKYSVAVNFDVYESPQTCQGSSLNNPREGKVEITNLFFRRIPPKPKEVATKGKKAGGTNDRTFLPRSSLGSQGSDPYRSVARIHVCLGR